MIGRRKTDAPKIAKPAHKREVLSATAKKRIFTAIRDIAVLAMLIGVLGLVSVLSVSAAIVKSENGRIITESEASVLGNVDCILVLGCGVRPDGSPSDMLYDRVSVGIGLYNAGASDRLLMSGDHGRTDYDEVSVMKQLATDAGIDPDAVFCDHAGFSTYESLYRARDIFGAERVIIVTQEYHLSRALYIAEKLGLDAYGVSADLRVYGGQDMRDMREVAARFKDFFTSLTQPEPTYLGDEIPISGKGSATDG